jgi:hypothetical protein
MVCLLYDQLLYRSLHIMKADVKKRSHEREQESVNTDRIRKNIRNRLKKIKKTKKKQKNRPQHKFKPNIKQKEKKKKTQNPNPAKTASEEAR